MVFTRFRPREASGLQWLIFLATFRCPPNPAAVEWTPGRPLAHHTCGAGRQTARTKMAEHTNRTSSAAALSHIVDIRGLVAEQIALKERFNAVLTRRCGAVATTPHHPRHRRRRSRELFEIRRHPVFRA